MLLNIFRATAVVFAEFGRACLNSLGCSLGAQQRARYFILKNVDSPLAHTFDIPMNPPPKNNQKSISIRTADRKTLAVRSWVGKGYFSKALFDSIRNSLKSQKSTGAVG